MQKIDSTESRQKITTRISSNLDGINEQSQNYIKDVVDLINREIGINKIESIILFGSQRMNKEITNISDCDLLFIFKNRVSNRHIKEIEKYFISLEIKHNFLDSETDILHDALAVLQHSTGMFKSHFLSKKKYWEEANFHKIFNVNRVFSAIFAPRNIVLGNVIQNSTILYGEDIRSTIRPSLKISVREMVRSTVMNLFISGFSFLISPKKDLNPLKYQLEAIKWSLRSANFYCFRDSESLYEIIGRFISFEKPRKQQKASIFFNRFIQLRTKPSHDLRFMVRCPVRILKIHIKAILYRKLFREKRVRKPVSPTIKSGTDRSFPLQF